MENIATAMAKLAGILKSVRSILHDTLYPGSRPVGAFDPRQCAAYFEGAHRQLAVLRAQRTDLYGDFPELTAAPDMEMSPVPGSDRPKFFFSRTQLQNLAYAIEQILEIRANSELVTPTVAAAKNRVFISHGRAKDWLEVQAYIEKDIELETRELAQEPNLGRTILAKLGETSNDCDSAVIVMTGDDHDAQGQLRARETVIHEIGFFQGKYGLSRVCLMHEEGVNIPSNIHGLVYSPFPKGLVSAAFGLLNRELRAIYKK
jgi:predicted nucleotide-binding protein